MILYAWLLSAAALHTPVHALGLLDSTIKQPVRLHLLAFSLVYRCRLSFLLLVLTLLLGSDLAAVSLFLGQFCLSGHARGFHGARAVAEDLKTRLGMDCGARLVRDTFLNC